MAKIVGHVFAKALAEAGVVHGLGSVTRIVIDVREPMGPVKVYVERIGDEKLIDLAALLAGED